MKTRIDGAIAAFTLGVCEDDGVTDARLQALLDSVREAFGLDVAYILEKVAHGSLYRYRCVSCSKPEYAGNGLHFRLPAEECDAALHMYDDSPVCDHNTNSLSDRDEISNTILHYGFVRKKLRSYDGSVGFQLFSPHVWTEEEREALRKLGFTLRAYFSVPLAEGVNEQLFQQLQEEQIRYRNALVKGCLYSFPFDITEGIIREQVVTSHGVDIMGAVGLRPPVGYDEMNTAYTRINEVHFLVESMRDCLTCAGLLRRFAEGSASPEWEYYEPARDLYVRVAVYMYEDPVTGHVHGLLTAADITASRKQEEMHRQALQAAFDAANQASEAKTAFLSNMSHDIRTPMNAIIGMTAIAGAHLDDRRRVEDCLTKITAASRHLLGLINEVLDMSKIESGKMDLQEEAFSLSDAVERLVVLSMPQMEQKKHDFRVSLTDVEHERVVGDSERLQQAFMNLLSNAAKYTPDGGTIRLYITEKPQTRPGLGCYEFVFEDNGIGMSEEFQTRLFEPFVRSDDSRVGKIQGTGLGMTITQTIVRMMNGDIQVESHLNQGTKITVTVFLQLQDGNEAESIDRFAELPVLVTDDDQAAGEYTAMILTELGMDCEYVLTGREAVERVRARHETGVDYFAVILDWRMPEMDGVETARQIRKTVGSDVPIIILSSYDWSDIESEAREAGVNAFISKPLFKSRLVHLFHSILEPGDSEEDGVPLLERFQQEKFPGKRALLAEDNQLNAEIAGEVLSMASLEVDYAVDGKQALDMVASHPEGYYDIIFMDIQMPVMNGYESAQAIRALPRPDAASVPIVAMTANAFSEDALAAKNAGMNEHIPKPIDFKLLLKTLNHWLGEKQV